MVIITIIYLQDVLQFEHLCLCVVVYWFVVVNYWFVIFHMYNLTRKCCESMVSGASYNAEVSA